MTNDRSQTNQPLLFVLVPALCLALGPACRFDPAGVPPPGGCGDGVAAANEECDLQDLRGQTCTSLNLGTGGLACGPSCTYDVSGCSVQPVCGNSNLEGSEQCDDGNTQPGDGCSPTCQLEANPDCGNGQLDPGEQCDDGNNAPCDSCSPLCQAEVCGNQVIDCGETCDDGNTQGGDGCSPTCQAEAPPSCGDHVIDPGEQCDDGNTTPCDGCSAACQSESCGNGVVECGEECDDGNGSNTDGCLSDCTLPFCGDGFIWAGHELCEQGQLSSDCANEGYSGGTLACGANCQSYDYSQCTSGDGGACTSDGQCAGGYCYLESVDGFPGGYCTSDCYWDPCGPQGACFSVSGGDRCYQRCNTGADCRDGYYCRVDPFTYTDLICRPLCTADSQCPATGQCNIYTGRCGSHFDPSLGDNGDACGGGDCRGGCWDGWDNGYCVSECNMSNPSCPGDGVCSAIFGGVSGDRGYCLDGCVTPPDCPRPGFTCRANPYGSGQVCAEAP
ncbi:MAG: DUF4215 domain-containing protein [bacterium]